MSQTKGLICHPFSKAGVQYCTLIGEYTSYSLIQFNTETLRQSVVEVVVKLNPSPAEEGRSVRELYPSPAGMIKCL